jgi:uncharacterized protein (DUF362 family)
MKSVVSIVQRKVGGSPARYSPANLETIKEMIGESVELLGGFDRIVSRGDKVFIKANIVTGQPPESVVCTDPRVLEALISLLKGRGCRRVFVGEGASVDVTDAREAFEGTGIDKVVERAGGEVVYLDEEGVVDVAIPGGQVLKHLSFPRVVLDANVFISVPKMKTHVMTLVTLGIKNSQGILRREDKVRFHREDFYVKMIDVLRALKPSLVLIDGILAGEGFGPIYPDPVEMNLIIASTDVVAADAVASAVMGMDPFEVVTTRLAHTEGLGVGELDLIEVRGKSIEEVKRYFRRPLWNPIGFSSNAIVYAGGACHFCMSQISSALERLKRYGLLDKMERTGIVTGVNPPVPGKFVGKIVVVGDCAKEYAKLGTFVAGCPPLPHMLVARALGCPI